MPVAVVALLTAYGTQAASPNHANAMTPAATFIKIPYADLQGWAQDDHLAAFKALLRSCDRLLKIADGQVPPKRKPSPPELVHVCRLAAAEPALTRGKARAFFERHFAPHRIEHAKPAGLLTGYYEPVLKGSRVQTAEFHTPVYRRPPDLTNVVDESERGAKSHLGLTHVRSTPAGKTPFPTRAQIEQGALAGQQLELLYLKCPVETFFMHIQGSGRIELPDGSSVRLSYDGKNGHPYTSIGSYLIKSGQFAADRVSLGGLTKWLRADLQRGREVMWQNKSFVFFRELSGTEADNVLGALEAGLTPGRSLAVDTAYHALGVPIWVDAPGLTHAVKGKGFHRLMIAQDVGSAIKGPERGDIYFGSGAKAGRLAGITKHPGHFFVLLPKDQRDAAGASAVIR